MEHTNDTSRLARLRERTKVFRFVILAGSMILDSFNVEGLAFDQISIATHFGIDTGVASWSLSAYSLTFGSFLLLSGSAGDVFGHRQIFITGLVGFAVFAALTAAIDSSAVALFVLRAFQGICAAATIPTAYALVANLYDGKARELAVAGLGACQAFGAVVGTILGGAFAESPIGYRGLLWLSSGLSALFSALAILILPPAPYRSKARSLDYVGAGIMTSASLFLVFGFTEAQSSWSQAKVIAPIGVGTLMILLFILWEEVFLNNVVVGIDPLIPKRVWGYTNLVPIFVITGLSFGSYFLLVLNGAQFLVRIQGQSGLNTALMYLPVAIVSLILFFILGPLYNHRLLPPKWFLIAGEVFIIAGEVLFSQNNAHTVYWWLSFPGFVLIGIGTACYFINFLNIVFSSAPPEEQGLISGILQTVAQVSNAIAFAIGSSLVNSTELGALLVEYRNSFYFCIGCSGLAALVGVIFLTPVKSKAAGPGGEYEGRGIDVVFNEDTTSLSSTCNDAIEMDSWCIWLM